MNTTQRGIVTLLRSAITGEKLQLPEGFEMEAAMQTIEQQGLQTLAFEGAVNCGIVLQDGCMQQLQKRYYQSLIHSERQMRAVDQITNAFEANGIDYMLLKGTVLKRFYPKPELRSMGDADILIRVEQYDKIRVIMQNLGFAEGGESQHELVWKRNDLYLELHKALITPLHRDLYPYFGNGWSKAEKRDVHRYALQHEDEFVYLFTHMAKHYRSSGIGARHILDLYVYRQVYINLDETYIENAMEQIHLLEFYRNIRKLLAVWFENAETDEKTDYIGQYILSGGSWGDEETRFYTEQVKRASKSNQVNHSRAESILIAIFPPVEKLQHDYRILFKYPKLYPLFWIPRWIKGIICRPGEIIRKFAVLGKVSDEKVTARKQALNYVGLDFHN